MSFEPEVAGYTESYAPEAQSDEIRLTLAKESIARISVQIERIGSQLDQLQSDYAAGTVSIDKFEQAGRDLDAALKTATAKLALFEAQKDRLQNYFSNC